MSFHFGANQYDDAFVAKRLQQYQVPKCYRERPNTHHGFTTIAANDRGHLLPGIPRSTEKPFGTFVGTWDMPLKIPGNHYTNVCARSSDAVMKLAEQKKRGDICLNGNQRQSASPKLVAPAVLANMDASLPKERDPGAPVEKVLSPISPVEPKGGSRPASNRSQKSQRSEAAQEENTGADCCPPDCCPAENAPGTSAQKSGDCCPPDCCPDNAECC